MDHPGQHAGLELPAKMCRPDYSGNGIVNLMSSISVGRGGPALYEPLQLADDLAFSAFRNIVVVLIDGLGFQYLQQHGPDSHIAKYLRGPVSSVFPTTTAAAITTFLTGLAPAQHAITGWHVWLEEIRTLAAVLPFRSRTGHESLEARGIDATTLLDARPFNQLLQVDSHVISPQRIAHSCFNSAFSNGADIHPYKTLDDFWRTISAVVKNDNKEKYIYAYWSDFDHIGHVYGVGSDEARQQFELIDQGFGALVGELAGTDTLLVLTADHGIIDTTDESRLKLEDYRPLTAMLDIPLSGEPRAAYCYVHEGEKPAFAAFAGAELRHCSVAMESAAMVQEGFFGPGTPHARLGQRVGDYTLLMQDNFIIQDTLPGEKRDTLIGVHGGLTADELFVPLVVVET